MDIRALFIAVLLYSTPSFAASSLPDVIMTSLSYNAATGIFTGVVMNQGAAATPAGVYVGVSYSVDGVYCTWGGVNGPLAAGAKAPTGSNGGACPIKSGTHTITAFADDVNRFAESNETNNKLSQTITVGTVGPPGAVARTADFIDTIGVNTHISWTNTAWGNWGNIQNELNYLGVRHVRDGIPYDNFTMPFYQKLAQLGIKFNITTEIPLNFSKDIGQITKLLSTNPGSVTSIEGPNEYNTNHYFFNSQDSFNNISWGTPADSTLHSLVKANNTTSGLAVVSVSLANVNGSQLGPLGDQGALVDASNWHVYYYGGTQPAANMHSGIQNAGIIARGKPVYVTETGYYTAINATGWGASGVSESVQARLILNVLMDGFAGGARETFIYELMDNIVNPSSTDLENTLGIYHGDGTPKLAATALHNMTTILSDQGISAGTFNPSWLNGLTISGLPNVGHSYLMQKSNGHYFLIVWSEPAIWDTPRRTQIYAPPSPINISLGRPAKFSVYDPIVGAGAVITNTGQNSIATAVVDHPIIIEISQ